MVAEQGMRLLESPRTGSFRGLLRLVTPGGLSQPRRRQSGFSPLERIESASYVDTRCRRKCKPLLCSFQRGLCPLRIYFVHVLGSIREHAYFIVEDLNETTGYKRGMPAARSNVR